MSRRIVIAGNWKMNHGPSDAQDFFRRLELPAELPDGLEVLVVPPALSLAAALDADTSGGRVAFGVQNVHWEASGAFTGELSTGMVFAAGASHVLIGHSERRHVFGETDEETGWKVRAVLDAGLNAVLCVGETLEERRVGRLEEVILRQLDAGLGPSRESGSLHSSRLLVAYEPVWAIGTGETATPADASAAHSLLRGRLMARWSADSFDAAEVPILYGGSVKPGNVAELLAAPEVDGVLVGGASLDPDSFGQIVAAGVERLQE